MKITYKTIHSLKKEIKKELLLFKDITFRIVRKENHKQFGRNFKRFSKSIVGFHTNAICDYYKRPVNILINADFKTRNKKTYNIQHVLYHEIGHVYYYSCLVYSPNKIGELLGALAKHVDKMLLNKKSSYYKYRMMNEELFADGFAWYFSGKMSDSLRQKFENVIEPFLVKNKDKKYTTQFSNVDMVLFFYKNLHGRNHQLVNRPNSPRRSKSPLLEHRLCFR